MHTFKQKSFKVKSKTCTCTKKFRKCDFCTKNITLQKDIYPVPEMTLDIPESSGFFDKENLDHVWHVYLSSL